MVSEEVLSTLEGEASAAAGPGRGPEAVPGEPRACSSQGATRDMELLCCLAQSAASMVEGAQHVIAWRP